MIPPSRWLLPIAALLLTAAIPARAASQAPPWAPGILSPGDLDFSDAPLRDLHYEVRWIARPASPEADTGFVYMKFEDILSEHRPAIRVEWRPFTARHLPNVDLIILDASTYSVRYRLEARAGGGLGIFWYEEDRAFAAQVDSLGRSDRAEIALERPVFSVPTLPWVLSQLAGRIEEPVRIELAGFQPDQGGSVSRPLVRRGREVEYRPPEGGSTYPGREMVVEFASGSTWTYAVSDAPPYFLSIMARNPDGVLTSRVEVVDWAPPALDVSRRIPALIRQAPEGGS